MSRSLVVLIGNVVVLLLLLSYEASASLPAGSRAILRVVTSDDTKPKSDYGVELNATNFDAVLRDTPAAHAVVEFFAHWCPACRNYKPHYEKVARLFNGPDAVHPGIVLMTRVDCAQKINSNLCDKFSVSHYPMLFWGSPSKFVSDGWEPKDENNEIRVIDDGRTAERLLSWINKQLGSSYDLNDEKFENENLPLNISDPGQIARAVYDVEEATATAFDLIYEHKMIKPETRASLIRFLQLLVVHHPSKRCRKGSAALLVNFDNLYPSDTWSPNKQEVLGNDKGVLESFQICGKDIPRGYWMFCRGSKNDTRGFSFEPFTIGSVQPVSDAMNSNLKQCITVPHTLSCGLWVLLHSLSVRIEDAESQFAFIATCDFIHNFFVCDECREHFYQMCSSVSTPFNTSRDFALWLWSAHNKVNERLRNDEESLGTGDPKFPKIIWPPKQLCSSCYLSYTRREDGTNQVNWDMNEVYKFLSNYYGRTLASLYEEKGLHKDGATAGTLEDLVASTSAVVVPIGAALAIALASCAFGALACYWRSHQKSRKPRRKLELR